MLGAMTKRAARRARVARPISVIMKRQEVDDPEAWNRLVDLLLELLHKQRSQD
jgi:hypothetical protein